jgi:hypothetical protein
MMKMTYITIEEASKLSAEQLEEMKLDFNSGIAKTKIAKK